MAKPSLKDFIAEEEAQDALEAQKEQKEQKTQRTHNVQKVDRGRGRPKSKPDSRLCSFHLPLDLIQYIDATSEDVAGGNKSLFIIKLLRDHLTKNTANMSGNSKEGHGGL